VLHRGTGRAAHLGRMGSRRSGELGDQIARLQRSCHRLVWLNPLLGTADYAPLTRGLQAALPFVDDFLPARTLTNLTDLAIHLNALD
jgi:Protein containing von Willebrand factor type A (vWA) domain